MMRYQDRLRIYIANRAVNISSSSDDIIQETLLKMHQACGKFDGRNFPGYLFRIAHNEIINHFNAKKKSFQELPAPDASYRDELTGLALIAKRESNQELLDALHDCLKEVGEDFTRVFLMKIRDGLSAAEIAKQQGVAEGTVYSRTSRAKENLKDCIEGKLS